MLAGCSAGCYMPAQCEVLGISSFACTSSAVKMGMFAEEDACILAAYGRPASCISCVFALTNTKGTAHITKII